MALDVKFNSWSLSGNTGFTEARVGFGVSVPSRSSKSVRPFGGASHASTFGARRISVSGSLSALTPGSDPLSAAYDEVGLILSKLRGSDLEMSGRLDLYGNGHWWAHLAGTPNVQVVDPVSVSLALEFIASDPFRRSNSLQTKTATPITPDFDVTFQFATDHDGEVPRMPLSVNLGGSWQKDELVTITSDIGWTFEHIVTQNLSASQDLVIDGEDHVVLEAGSPVAEGVSGNTFPYLVGGTTQTLDLTGSSRFQAFTWEWYDRFWS